MFGSEMTLQELSHHANLLLRDNLDGGRKKYKEVTENIVTFAKKF